MSSVEFRPVCEDQIPAVAAMWQASGLVRPWNPPEADIRQCMGKTNSEVLVAGEGGKIHGALIVCHDNNRGWVYRLGVDPDLQKGGVGRAAMEAAEAWLKARGMAKVQLLVRESNTAVMGFYRSLGYENAKVVTLQKWIDPVREKAFREFPDGH